MKAFLLDNLLYLLLSGFALLLLCREQPLAFDLSRSGLHRHTPFSLDLPTQQLLGLLLLAFSLQRIWRARRP